MKRSDFLSTISKFSRKDIEEYLHRNTKRIKKIDVVVRIRPKKKEEI
jgi:hypothetical protein